MVVLSALLAIALFAVAQPRPNIALHCPYTLSPAPNYGLCGSDPGRTLLTDGIRTQGYFWTQQTTTGWSSARPATITIDLGASRPISGISYSTAAGVAGVAWPLSIDLFVSDDGKEWWPAGELVSLSRPNGEPPAGYALHTYRTEALHCRGRYVALQVTSGSDYTFCDEVEVYGGPEEWMHEARTGEPTNDLGAAYRRRVVQEAVRREVRAGVAVARTDLKASAVPAPGRVALSKELDAIEAALADYQPPSDFRAIVPYCDQQRHLFAVWAALWRSRGMRATLWQSGRYDPILPGDLPPAHPAAPVIDLVMLSGEIRAGVFNVTNPLDHQLDVTVTVSNLARLGRPTRTDALTLCEVAYTGTRSGNPVASALPAAERAGQGWTIHVPSGMTRQAWVSFGPGIPAGAHRGELVLKAGHSVIGRVPVRLRVLREQVPARLSLSLGGWDYTHQPTYGITQQNLGQVVAFLKRYHVDAPWANANVMPFGEHDGTGAMVRPPDTGVMDQWLERWKGARTYFVFNSFDTPLGSSDADRRRVEEWIRFWVRHLGEKGIRASQLGLLLVDEPREAAHDQAILSYARVIRGAEPEVVLFEDPIWPDPRRTTREMMENCTLLCPNRPMWIEKRKEYEEVFLAQQKAGRQLAFYSCSGPVRMLDPYSYQRLQAWDCYRYGMVHMGYWAFGDNSGASSWNEFAASGPGFAPEFLGPDGAVTSKHMEAIREGLFDHQALTLLAHAADQVGRTGKNPGLVAEARALLADGPRRVTEAAGAGKLWWNEAKDRTVADQVRLEALRLLARLDSEKR